MKWISPYTESVAYAIVPDRKLILGTIPEFVLFFIVFNRLVGFGAFYASKVAARNGRNPKIGEVLKIAAYTQPKFRAGKGLKEAYNKK